VRSEEEIAKEERKREVMVKQRNERNMTRKTNFNVVRNRKYGDRTQYQEGWYNKGGTKVLDPEHGKILQKTMEIDRQKKEEEMNVNIEDVMEGTSGIAKELSTEEIEGMDTTVLH
nr:hypothetical protein [Tanacetum cinerariifolium]GFA11306.1 hypothetical protein [Tanacetum cinerariifolium]GFA11312.1 hypothetical protein [Tanacetum cinerariifolium]